jgi:LysR family transcriptional regulator, nitrogen assimilation regulatory protein
MRTRIDLVRGKLAAFTGVGFDRTMELRQLRYFVAIAAAGSLSKASERLRIAQPALSLQLANLEAYLGTKLFERYNRGVRLTQSGTMLLQHAVTILKGVNDASAARPKISRGRFRLGSPRRCRHPSSRRC